MIRFLKESKASATCSTWQTETRKILEKQHLPLIWFRYSYLSFTDHKSTVKWTTYDEKVISLSQEHVTNRTTYDPFNVKPYIGRVFQRLPESKNWVHNSLKESHCLKNPASVEGREYFAVLLVIIFFLCGKPLKRQGDTKHFPRKATKKNFELSWHNCVIRSNIKTHL